MEAMMPQVTAIRITRRLCIMKAIWKRKMKREVTNIINPILATVTSELLARKETGMKRLHIYIFHRLHIHYI